MPNLIDQRLKLVSYNTRRRKREPTARASFLALCPWAADHPLTFAPTPLTHSLLALEFVKLISRDEVIRQFSDISQRRHHVDVLFT